MKGTLVWLGVALLAAAVPRATVAKERPSLYDAHDGWLDLSGFFDTANGFVPLVMPITEPAVGYGALGTLVFIDRNAPVDRHFVRPNIAAAGGHATQNRTEMTLARRNDSYGILRRPSDPCRRNQGSAPSVLHRPPVTHQTRRSLPLR